MTTVEPKLIVNKPIEDMHPFISKEELNLWKNKYNWIKWNSSKRIFD
jgi:hypothetical protein